MKSSAMRWTDIPLVRHLWAWSGPDLLDLPFKAVVFFLLTTQLSKTEFGFVSLGMMIFSYNELLQFGVANALMLKLPEKYVKEDVEGIVHQTSTSMTFALLSHFSVLSLGLLMLSSISIDPVLLLAVWCYAAQAVIYQYYMHHLVYLRYTYDFSLASKIKLSAIIAKFLFEVSFLLLFGVYGFLFAQVLSFLVPIVFLHLLKGSVLTIRLVAGELRELLVLGFPFFLLSLLAITSGNIDRWFVAVSFSIEQFASYSVLMYIITVLLVFPNKLLSLLSQYLREVFVLDPDARNSFKYVLNILVMYGSVFPVVAFFAHLVLALVIHYYIPEYENVVPLLGISLLLYTFRAGLGVLVNYLYLMEYRKVLITSQMIGLILAIPLYWGSVTIYGPKLSVILIDFNLIISIQAGYILFKVCSKLGFRFTDLNELMFLTLFSASGFIFLSLINDAVVVETVAALSLSLAFILLAFYNFRRGRFIYVKKLAFRKHE